MTNSEWNNGTVIGPAGGWAGSRYVTLDDMPPPRTEGELEDLLMVFNNGGYKKYTLGNDEALRAALRQCSVIPSIISQKAFAFVKGTVTVWNPESEKPVRGQFKEWDELFRKPNAYQSQRQFFIHGYSYMQRHGYCVIEPTYPAIFKDRPTELNVIPNWAIEWEWSTFGRNKKPKAAYEVQDGTRRKLDIEKLIIIRDPAATEYQDNGFLPLSRAADLEGEISNEITSLISRGEMITDRGMVGIVSNASGKDQFGGMPLEPAEKARLQRAMDGYGIMRGQSKRIVSNASLTYTPTTFDVNELGLHPEHIANVKAICNRYSFPFTMLAEGFEGKYNNSTNGRRDFQDTTIDPESMDFFEQLSLGLKMYEQKCEVYMDYTGVASLQMSQKDKGQGKKAMNEGLKIEWDNNLITRNEWLDELGKERIENPLFDKYKWELKPEELGIVIPDNQNTNNNGNQDPGQGN